MKFFKGKPAEPDELIEYTWTPDGMIPDKGLYLGDLTYLRSDIVEYDLDKYYVYIDDHNEITSRYKFWHKWYDRVSTVILWVIIIDWFFT